MARRGAAHEVHRRDEGVQHAGVLALAGGVGWLAFKATKSNATKVAQGGTDKQTIAWIVAGIPAPVRIVQRENGATTISLQMNSWSR